MNDAPLVTPVYVGEASNLLGGLMDQLSGWSHNELWHKIAPYSGLAGLAMQAFLSQLP
jgi:hypothetical protein